MLLREGEFLKSTGMSKDELYAKIAKLQLLGVDFKMDDIDKVLYKGQYYNRKTDEAFTGYFHLIHYEPNTMQLFFIDDSKSITLSYVTVSSELVYLLKDNHIAQLKFFMEFIREDYSLDFTQLDVLFNISGMDKKDFNTKLAKARLLGVSLDAKFTVPFIRYTETYPLICEKVNDMTYMLTFNDFIEMISYDILLVIGSVNDLMKRYLNALYEYHQLKGGLLQ